MITLCKVKNLSQLISQRGYVIGDTLEYKYVDFEKDNIRYQYYRVGLRPINVSDFICWNDDSFNHYFEKITSQ